MRFYVCTVELHCNGTYYSEHLDIVNTRKPVVARAIVITDSAHTVFSMAFSMMNISSSGPKCLLYVSYCISHSNYV